MRLALVLQGIKFEDERINFAQWGEMKPKTKFGQLPILTIDGKHTVAQSDAMLRYVARLDSKTLYPTEPLQQLQVEEVLGLVGDFAKAWLPAFYLAMRPEMFGYEKDFHKTEEGKALVQRLREEFVKDKLPQFMEYFTNFIGKNKFLCGNEVTIADCAFLPAIARFSSGDIDFVAADTLAPYPAIVEYIARVKALPKIAAWYAPKPEVKEEAKEEAKQEAPKEADAAAPAAKRVLVVLTSNDKLGETGEQTGWYLPEVAHPHKVFTDAGFQLTYASIKGGEAPIDLGSIEASQDEDSQAFYKDEAAMKLTKETIPIADAKASDYDVIFYAGGFGTMWDFPDSTASSDLAGQIYDNGGIVSAVCHGPSALVNVKTSDGEFLVKGKKVTAFTNAEEDAVKRREIVPFTCEDKLVERGAEFVDGGVFKESVCVSDRLMTGQNPPSAGPLAKAIVAALN